MTNYKVKTRGLQLVDYQYLRKTTDWPPLDDGAVNKALRNDLYSVCVHDGDNIVGMGRVIGDGAIYFYIQDVIVLPSYQGKGIGKLIMSYIETFLESNANNNSFVGLMAADGVEAFYNKFNFIKRPDNKPGMYKHIRKDYVLECV